MHAATGGAGAGEARPAGRKTRIVIADDHPLVLAGVRQTLEEDGRFEIVGEAEHGSDVLPLISRVRPEVVLLDVRMPSIDGLTCLERIVSLFPWVKVVMLSMSSNSEEIQQAFRRGAAGYIVKNLNPRDLAPAIRQALDGTAFHAMGPPGVRGQTVGSGWNGLTARQLEIIKALARGLSNRAIAEEFAISEQTVKFHLGNIFRKLGVSNRTEAARWAPNDLPQRDLNGRDDRHGRGEI